MKNIKEYLEEHFSEEQIYPLETSDKLVFQFVMEDLEKNIPEHVINISTIHGTIKPIDVFQKLSANENIELFSMCRHGDSNYEIYIYSESEKFLTLHKQLISNGDKTFESLLK